MILCECGEFIEGHIFKDYIKANANPSTPTIGHCNCGLIFNFIDDEIPKRYSSKKELKSIAAKFAEINKLSHEAVENLLIEVEQLKSSGCLSDGEIIVKAFSKVLEKRSGY